MPALIHHTPNGPALGRQWLAVIVIWLWGGLAPGGDSLLTAQPRIKFQNYSLEDGLSQSYVFCLLQDSQGFLWLGTEDGLNRFDGYRFTVYRHDADDPNTISHNNIRSLHEDDQGNLYIGTMYGGLNRFDRTTGTFQRFTHDPADSLGLSHNGISAMVNGPDGSLWIGTFGGGLNVLYPGRGALRRYLPRPDEATGLSNGTVLDLALDDAGKVWIGTVNGLNCFDPATGRFRRYFHDPLDRNSLSANRINALYRDHSGNLWIGASRGLDRYDPQADHFIRHLPDGRPTPETASISVTALEERKPGELWVGTTQGVTVLCTASGKARPFRHHAADPTSLGADQVYSLDVDAEGGIWIGTGNGVSRFDPRRHRFAHYSPLPDQPRSLPSRSVWGFVEDPAGVLWVVTRAGRVPFDLENGVIPQADLPPQADGTVPHWYAYLKARDGIVWRRVPNASGLIRYDPQTGDTTFYYHDPQEPFSIGSHSVTHLLEDRRGNLWLGNRGGGLSRLDRKDNKFYHYLHDPEDPTSLSDNVVHALLEDRAGRLWVTTAAGLNLLDRETGRFRRFRERDGLLNEFIYGIMEDSQGRLWMSTNQGIACLDTKTMKFQHYGLDDGLQSNEYNDDAYYKSPTTGMMYFGGVNGFNAFYPDSIHTDTFRPPLVFTRLQYLERSGERAILKEVKGITEKKTIRLRHNQKTSVFIEFASLSYRAPHRNQYAYQLEGAGRDWVSLGTKREVSLVNPAAGDYILRVRGTNGDGYWNDVPIELAITILPPWYWAWYTKTLYLLVILSGIYALYRFQLNRRLARAETLRLQEMDAFKTRLYTNITHEFRTPLTVILGMEEMIRRNPGQQMKEHLGAIRRNGYILRRLVEQLLSLARVETGALPLHYVQGDIVAYLQYIVEAFKSYAEAKDIRLHFLVEEDNLIMDYDPDHLLHIVSNLLSNAVKFTPPVGDVYLTAKAVEPAVFELRVKDTGMGIPPEKLPRIFDRFYQVENSGVRKNEGAGIGLALTRELVHLMEGQIDVKSTPGRGTEFIVRLPLRNIAAPGEEQPDRREKIREEVLAFVVPDRSGFAGAQPVNSAEAPLVLIVEDNADVAHYLVACLESDYQIETARNGREGIYKARKLVPDLIISDVMMPEKDGFELCDILKNELVTSHIPIILLTARADVESKIAGLRRGADVYLPKPFHEAELRAHLTNQLALRRKLQERYSAPGYWYESEVDVEESIASLEDEFIARFRTVVEARLDDYDLDVDGLCRELAMSRTNLHNKIRALTGQSTTEYLRFIRLRKAAELLLSTDLTIYQIALETGFRHHTYFTRMFRDLFGCTPTVYREEGGHSVK